MRKRSGFTIIELLVVMAIIGILAVLVMTRVSIVRQRSQNSAAQSDITEGGKAIEIFKNNDTNDNNVVINAVATGGDTLDGDPGGAANNVTGIFTGAFAINTNGATNRYGSKFSKTPAQSIFVYKYDTANTAAGTLGRVDAAGNNGTYVLSTSLNQTTGAQAYFWVQNGTANSGVSAPSVP